MQDDDVARQIFLNAPYSWRRQDVQATEHYASDIKHYRPRDNDWPGVDDEGADPLKREWEKNHQLFGEMYPDIDKNISAQNRGVVGYVNWYGDDNVRVLDKEPKRTWSIDESVVNQLTIVQLEADSVLYRSEPASVQMNSPPTHSWYTNRYTAIVYNNTHYIHSTEQKEVYPFIVLQPVPLMSMNEPRNIQFIANTIAAEQNTHKNTPTGSRLMDLLYNFLDAFPIDNVRGIVGRKSTVPVDNAFCNYFRTAFPRLAGWIYMRTENNQHHDEIWIKEPANYLIRAQYIVKEVRETRQQTNVQSSPPIVRRRRNEDDDDNEEEDDYGPPHDSDDEILDLVNNNLPPLQEEIEQRGEYVVHKRFMYKDGRKVPLEDDNIPAERHFLQNGDPFASVYYKNGYIKKIVHHDEDVPPKRQNF